MARSSESRCSASLFLLTALQLAVSLAAGQDQTCYWPEGNAADGWVPCSDSPYSSCCHRTAICMSNGLCLGTIPSVLARGACTDKTWRSPNCTQYCQSSNPEAGCSIVLYAITNTVPSYCCDSIVSAPDSDKLVCRDGNPFKVPDGDPIAGRGALKAMVLNTATGTTTPDSSSAPPASTETVTVERACNSSAAQVQQQPSRETAVGVGVGIPLGLIAAGLLTWALWERRGRMRAEPGGGDPQGIMDSHSVMKASEWETRPWRQSRPAELYQAREPVELASHGPRLVDLS